MEKTEKKTSKELEDELAEEKYYVIKELHLHHCQGVVILQQGQPTPPPKPPQT